MSNFNISILSSPVVASSILEDFLFRAFIAALLLSFCRSAFLISPAKLPFKNFIESQSFVNKVGDIAEKENHHPDISFGWGYCKVKIFTHAIKGLAESDFILAAKIDKI